MSGDRDILGPRPDPLPTVRGRVGEALRKAYPPDANADASLERLLHRIDEVAAKLTGSEEEKP